MEELHLVLDQWKIQACRQCACRAMSATGNCQRQVEAHSGHSLEQPCVLDPETVGHEAHEVWPFRFRSSSSPSSDDGETIGIWNFLSLEAQEEACQMTWDLTHHDHREKNQDSSHQCRNHHNRPQTFRHPGKMSGYHPD